MIIYSNEGVDFPKISRKGTTQWIRKVAADYGKTVGDVGYLFCNDRKILKVNRDYLGHDYYTDVITFDNTKGDVISGDIVISLSTVKTNAKKYKKDYDEELHRVIIHGILHLCGLKDKEEGEREIMEAAEDKALALLNSQAGK